MRRPANKVEHSCLGNSHSVGSPPKCIDKGLPVRTWRLRGLYAGIRGPYQDKSDRVAWQLQGNCRVTAGQLWACRTTARTAAGRDLIFFLAPVFSELVEQPLSHSHRHVRIRQVLQRNGPSTLPPCPPHPCPPCSTLPGGARQTGTRFAAVPLILPFFALTTVCTTPEAILVALWPATANLPTGLHAVHAAGSRPPWVVRGRGEERGERRGGE